jgi:hypothetical protein
MDNDICTQFEGLLQCRRAKAIVHRQQSARFMSNSRQRVYVAHFGKRVGWSFREE